MSFIPAYDRINAEPCILMDFVKKNVFHADRPASYGRQFESKFFGLVSYEDGTIVEVEVDTLVISGRWLMKRRRSRRLCRG